MKTTRIDCRKYGTDGQSPHASASTGIIKIGHRTEEKTKAGKPYKLPRKLPGFLILHDTVGPDNEYLIDYDAMTILGKEFTPKAIREAKAKGFKAPTGILPTELHVVIQHDAARREDGKWEYPGTYAEALECFGKEGLFCSGDGTTAMRKQSDGTEREVDGGCVPEGKPGAKKDDWCPYSCGDGKDDKKCKSHMRLIVCLFTVGDAGEAIHLSKSLGPSAKYRFDNSSDPIAIGILKELDGVAEQLDGRLGGLTGVLTFHKRPARTSPGSSVSVAIVGRVGLHLNPVDIARRKARLGGWQLDGPMEAPQRMIKGPEDVEPATPALVVEPDPDPELKDDGPDFSDPQAAKADEVRDILNYADDLDVDLGPVFKKAGVERVTDLTAEHRTATLEWLWGKAEKLKDKASKGEGT